MNILDMKRFDFGFAGEKLAIKLLNSKKINHIWKKDFTKNKEHHEKWDLINSNNIKIEVKSTLKEKRFNYNSISPNFPEQKKQIILKLLIKKNKIKKFKFVRFIRGKWKDITLDCLIN